MKREFCLKIYSILLGIILGLGLATINVQTTFASSRRDLAPPSTPAPSDNLTTQPNPDRLAIPVLAENPTQVELGSNVYYYNCMPCHGDQGQGLTDEFRQLWDEDHQNCWGRGCHGGRRDDQGFPLPRQIPAVNHLPGALMQFPTAEDLYTFLYTSHPPQRPGALEENEYWEVTAFLMEENGRLAPDGQIGPAGHQNLFDEMLAICGVLAAILLLAASLIWQAWSTQKHDPL